MDDRIVIPSNLQKRVLHALHSAHQGINNMHSRANQIIYWSGMNNGTRNIRYIYHTCDKTAPSRVKGPMPLTPSPDWLFQKICADYFATKGHSYLSIVDRFSCWISISIISNHIIQLGKQLLTYSNPYLLPTESQERSVPMEVLSLPRLHLHYS